MEILRIGETTHGKDFCVLREQGYPFYMLLLVETPALLETDGEWTEIPAGCAVLFRPGQRQSYRAAGESYTDCWMHIQGDAPLLYEEFPFGRPIPLCAPQRLYALFRIICDEFFAERRTQSSVLSALGSALIDMVFAEIDVRGPQFLPLLSLREEIFRAPQLPWRAEEAAARAGLSCGHFHVLYRQYFRTTFLADVIAARIQRAEELLLSGTESIAAVAERCGYENAEHFYRQFKAVTGKTPRAFRRGGDPTK